MAPTGAAPDVGRAKADVAACEVEVAEDTEDADDEADEALPPAIEDCLVEVTEKGAVEHINDELVVDMKDELIVGRVGKSWQAKKQT